MRDRDSAASTSHSDNLKIVLIYAVFASLWILFSDRVAEGLFVDASTLQFAQTIKGWFFVTVTSILLYFLLKRTSGRFTRSYKPGRYRGLVNWKPWRLYLFAATITLCTLLIRQSIAISFDEHPMLILFMFPVILSAALGGLGPGLLSTLIAALTVTYFSIPPIGSFRIEHSYDLFQLGFLVADGVLVSYLSEMLHQARFRSEQERLNAESILAEKTHAMELLDSIAEGSTDAIYAKDWQGRYQLFNRAAARFVGKSEKEVLGKDDAAIFPQDQAGVIQSNDLQVMQNNQAVTYQENLSTKGGKTFFLSTKGPLHDAAGKVVGMFGISRDITAIKANEEALRRERDSNKRYLDTVQTIMLVLDTEGRITMVNRFGCELLGYRETDLLGENWFKACLPQPEGTETILPLFRRILAGDLDAARHYENPVLCRDGTRRMISWNNTYFKNEAGNIVGTLSSGEDITGRRTAENALRESELTYRSLFENMLNGFAYCRMLYIDGRPEDFIYLSVNEAFETQTGLKDVVGRKVSKVIPGIREADPELFDIYGRVAAGGKPEHLETFVQALDMWFSISIYSPKPEHFVAVFDVITERKKAEIALREAEAQYRSLFENNMDGVLLTVPFGGIVAANAESQRIFGYTRDEMLNLNRQQLVDITDPRLAEAEKERAENGKARSELTLINKKGTRFPGEVSSVLFKNEHGQEMTVVIVHDITARKAREATLFRQTEEVRQRNEELERFNLATVGREVDMIALKQQINELSRQLGKAPPFPLSFLATSSETPTEDPGK